MVAYIWVSWKSVNFWAVRLLCSRGTFSLSFRDLIGIIRGFWVSDREMSIKFQSSSFDYMSIARID